MLCLRRELGTTPERRTLVLDYPPSETGGRVKVILDRAPVSYGPECFLLCIDAPKSVRILRAELLERDRPEREPDRSFGE